MLMFPDFGRKKRPEAQAFAPPRPALQLRVPCTAARPPRADPPSSPASSSSDESLPSPSTFIRPRLKAQPHPTPNQSPTRPQQTTKQSPERSGELDGHEWPLRGILAQRETVDGLEYLAEWEESTLAARHVQTREDGSQFVRCEGHDWNTREVAGTPSPLSDAAEPHVQVAWENTWRHEDDLNTKSNDVSSFIWRLAATNEDDAPPPAEGERLTLPERFKPEAGLDYGPAMRRFFREDPSKVTSKNISILTQAKVVRPTTIRETAMVNRIDFNLGRTEKHAAMLSYSSALEQTKPCGCCARGLGPFPVCAVSLNTGACVNCMFDARGPSCDFHADRMSCHLSLAVTSC